MWRRETLVSTSFLQGLPGPVNWGPESKHRGPAWVSSFGPNDKAGPLSFRGWQGACAPRLVPDDPGYGREPVGNGHAAAGVSAILAPELAAVDGAFGAVIAGLAIGLAACIAFFFFSAFFFFLADFFLPAAFFLPAFFNAFFFFFDAFFFFFFFPPFFAFFLAMLNLLQGC